jgi:Protein of unknown function (DUF4239)
MDEIILQIFSSQWHVIFVLSALLLLAAEIGFRGGRSFSLRVDAKSRGILASLQASILGLLALLLGFSFSMAVTRYDHRRDLVVDEANSIGTTYLRASFLPPQEQEIIKETLKQYVKNRIRFYEAGNDMGVVAEREKEARSIHKILWSQLTQISAANNEPLTASFVTSLNQTIDLDAKRLAAMRNHVPPAVWLLLSLVGTCGISITGYHVGLAGRRLWLNQWLFPLLIASVITILIDLDSPRRGLVEISQQSLIDLDAALSSQH